MLIYKQDWWEDDFGKWPTTDSKGWSKLSVSKKCEDTFCNEDNDSCDEMVKTIRNKCTLFNESKYTLCSI